MRHPQRIFLFTGSAVGVGLLAWMLMRGAFERSRHDAEKTDRESGGSDQKRSTLANPRSSNESAEEHRPPDRLGTQQDSMAALLRRFQALHQPDFKTVSPLVIELRLLLLAQPDQVQQCADFVSTVTNPYISRAVMLMVLRTTSGSRAVDESALQLMASGEDDLPNLAARLITYGVLDGIAIDEYMGLFSSWFEAECGHEQSTSSAAAYLASEFAFRDPRPLPKDLRPFLFSILESGTQTDPSLWYLIGSDPESIEFALRSVGNVELKLESRWGAVAFLASQDEDQALEMLFEAILSVESGNIQAKLIHAIEASNPTTGLDRALFTSYALLHNRQAKVACVLALHSHGTESDAGAVSEILEAEADAGTRSKIVFALAQRDRDDSKGTSRLLLSLLSDSSISVRENTVQAIAQMRTDVAVSLLQDIIAGKEYAAVHGFAESWLRRLQSDP